MYRRKSSYGGPGGGGMYSCTSDESDTETSSPPIIRRGRRQAIFDSKVCTHFTYQWAAFINSCRSSFYSWNSEERISCKSVRFLDDSCQIEACWYEQVRSSEDIGVIEVRSSSRVNVTFQTSLEATWKSSKTVECWARMNDANLVSQNTPHVARRSHAKSVLKRVWSFVTLRNTEKYWTRSIGLSYLATNHLGWHGLILDMTRTLHISERDKGSEIFEPWSSITKWNVILGKGQHSSLGKY